MVVHTREGEHLIRTPLAELIAGLDPEVFWQIHRSSIVNMEFVAGTRRDESGRLFVRMRNSDTELPVSRAYMQKFRQM
ncbi:CO-responsive transcriptional regulator RcoM [compost metagenome]